MSQAVDLAIRSVKTDILQNDLPTLTPMRRAIKRLSGESLLTCLINCSLENRGSAFVLIVIEEATEIKGTGSRRNRLFTIFQGKQGSKSHEIITFARRGDRWGSKLLCFQNIMASSLKKPVGRGL
jgi:hypothetical protein